MRILPSLLVSTLLLLASGCYKLDIRQGNIIEQDTIERLRTGMSRRQVQALLGSPAIVDPFHQQRWDYIYNLFPRGNESRGERRRLALFFEGDTLSRIDGDLQPTSPPETVASDTEPAAIEPVAVDFSTLEPEQRQPIPSESVPPE